MKKLDGRWYWGLGLIVVVGLIIAGLKVTPKEVSPEDHRVGWHKNCYEKVSFQQLASNPGAYVGKGVKFQAQFAYRAKPEVRELPSPQWQYSLFDVVDREHHGKEIHGIYFATMRDNQTLPSLEQPIDLKRFYGEVQQKKDGSFYFKIHDVEEVLKKERG